MLVVPFEPPELFRLPSPPPPNPPDALVAGPPPLPPPPPAYALPGVGVASP